MRIREEVDVDACARIVGQSWFLSEPSVVGVDRQQAGGAAEDKPPTLSVTRTQAAMAPDMNGKKLEQPWLLPERLPGRPLRYVSLCSGIEAASAAWEGLGWRALAFAEVEPFVSEVLRVRFPGVPNHGDMTRFDWSAYRGKADVVVAGCPCQDFSLAGLRAGLAGDRGNLSLQFIRIVDAINPAFVLWENVPGVLTAGGKENDGEEEEAKGPGAFGCFLGGLVGEDSPLKPPGTRWPDAGVVAGPKRAAAWRTLDAQHFGLAQRRRRVFVVACPRGGADPSEVLFERMGLRRDTAPRGKAREGAAPAAGGRAARDTDDLLLDSGGLHVVDMGGATVSESMAPTLMTASGEDIAPALIRRMEAKTGSTQDAAIIATPTAIGGQPTESNYGERGGGDRDTLVVDMGGGKGGAGVSRDRAPTLNTSYDGHAVLPAEAAPKAMAFQPGNLSRRAGANPSEELFPTLGSETQGDQAPCVASPVTTSMESCWADGIAEDVEMIHATTMQVRRLTPTECERLMGFRDNFTRIPWRGRPAEECPDGPRYRALGNSMAVPCLRWLGRRIQIVNGILEKAKRGGREPRGTSSRGAARSSSSPRRRPARRTPRREVRLTAI